MPDEMPQVVIDAIDTVVNEARQLRRARHRS
jgi:hypothetical protein